MDIPNNNPQEVLPVALRHAEDSREERPGGGRHNTRGAVSGVGTALGRFQQQLNALVGADRQDPNFNGDGRSDCTTITATPPIKKDRKYWKNICERKDATYTPSSTHPTTSPQEPTSPAPPTKPEKKPTKAIKKPLHLAVGKNSKTSTPDEIRDVPLHVKNVGGNINYERLLKMAENWGHPKTERLRELLRFNTDPTMYTPMADDIIDKTKPSQLPLDDIIKLHEVGQMRRVQRSFVKATLEARTVTESKVPQDCTKFYTGDMLRDLSDEVRKKRRTIQHTKWNNDLTTYEAKMEILNLKQDLQQCRAGDYAACADMMMSFSQMGLSEGVQAFHCLLDQTGQWWCSTVAVMGERYVPELMELVTDVLSTVGQSKNVCLEVERKLLRTKTHIDNVRFLHPNPFFLRSHPAVPR